jgi:recombinase, phage RecT family
MQECAYVPFYNGKLGRKEAQFMPMYQGLIKLVTQTGFVRKMDAQVVYENDKFDFEYGSKEYLSHRPCLRDRGEKIAVYAAATLDNGEYKFIVMSREDVEAIKKSSKAANSDKMDSPWKHAEFEDAMWRKTAIKQLCKLLPKSTEVAQAIELDNQAETQEQKPNIPINIESVAATIAEPAPKEIVSSDVMIDKLNI